MVNNYVKTTNACKFKKPILLGFEKGWSAISGIKALPINSWKDALDAKKQLLKDAEKAKAEGRETYYSTVITDTADIAYDLAERYILQKEGVDSLDETQLMRGYRMLSREYDKFFQELVKAGYTLVIISHATSKQIKENGERYDKTIPTIPDRGFLVVSRLVDITAYASYETDENGNTMSMLTMRGNKHLEAGSRYKYTSEKIPFTYQDLLDDMNQAIDRQEADGDTVINEENNLYVDTQPQADFDETLEQIKKAAVAFHNEDKYNLYTKTVEEYLGKGKQVRDCDESQIDLMVLILDDLKDIAEANEIDIVNVE